MSFMVSTATDRPSSTEGLMVTESSAATDVPSVAESSPGTGDPHQSMRVVTGFEMCSMTPLLQAMREHLQFPDLPNDTFQAAVEDQNLDQQLVIITCDSRWPQLDHLDEKQFGALHSVLTRSKALLWISETSDLSNACPQHFLVTGLARTLRLERSGLIFTTVTFDEKSKDRYVQHIAQALENTLVGIKTGIYEAELTVVEGYVTIPRLYEDDSLNQTVHASVADRKQSIAFGERNLDLQIGSVGLLESLYFEEAPHDPTLLAPDELEVEIRCVGVNFKDILVAHGHVKDSTFGYESSGVALCTGSACRVKPGERVVVSHLGSFRRTIRCRQSAVEALEEGMSFADAASISVNFITAYHALIDTARLACGETILIHAGAGGTGQAAIWIAQHCGTKVFITVGSDERRDLLMRLYNVPADHIFYSWALSFAKGIKRLIEGKGVDVILNSLAGPSLLASWECIAPYGRFIEIEKRDILARHNLPMFQFAQNATFSAVDLAEAGRQRPELVSRCLRQVLSQGRSKSCARSRYIPSTRWRKPFGVYRVERVRARSWWKLTSRFKFQ